MRLGGYSQKNAPRPDNAPVGRQSMTLTREDQGLLVDFMPIAGDIKGGVEGAEFISEEFKRENPNYLLMGIVGGAAVLGVIPFAGDAAQKMIMSGARKFRKNRVTEETLEMLSEQDAQVVQALTDKTPVSELTESQRLADEIASDLRAGNIDAVTDTRLEGLDFKGDIRLRQHYIDGNVGTDADGVTITLDNAQREQRMIDQGYTLSGAHGSGRAGRQLGQSEMGPAGGIKSLLPGEGTAARLGKGVYIDPDVPSSPGTFRFETANKFAGYDPDVNRLGETIGQGDPNKQFQRMQEGASIFPVVVRSNPADYETQFKPLRDKLLDNPNFIEKLRRKINQGGDALVGNNHVFPNIKVSADRKEFDRAGDSARNVLEGQGYTGVSDTTPMSERFNPGNIGELTSFDGSGIRARSAIFDPRLTELKNIGMADGGAVMNGIGTLNETARNMTRGPRGIGAYQQFAPGGEVLRPQSRPPEMRPQSRPPEMRPQSRPPEMQEMAEIRAYLDSLTDSTNPDFRGERNEPDPDFRGERNEPDPDFRGMAGPNVSPARPEKYFEINSYDVDGETREAIDFKDGMRMFMPDVGKMIHDSGYGNQPVVGKETAAEVLEFLQENNPTSQQFIDYFSSARLAMGGEVSGPPPMRGPDPQGIGAFQQYADGGPVYMSRGGAPDEITARQASQEDLANLAKMVRENYGFDPVAVALEQGIDPELALRVMYEESKGKQSAGSEKGARGLMQLMPGTAEELGVDINDALDNYTGGLKYLKKMTNQFGLEVGLAAYNAGPGNVEEYQGVPPFKETQNYLRIIAEPFTGNSVEGLLNTGAENFMMSQPVFNEEDVARGRGVRPLTRPTEIEFSAPLTSLTPQARPPMMQPPNSPPMMRPQNRPLALPEGQSMIEKYGLPGDMPGGGIISAIR